MKKTVLDLNLYGMMELNQEELFSIDGGRNDDREHTIGWWVGFVIVCLLILL